MMLTAMKGVTDGLQQVIPRLDKMAGEIVQKVVIEVEERFEAPQTITKDFLHSALQEELKPLRDALTAITQTGVPQLPRAAAPTRHEEPR